MILEAIGGPDSKDPGALPTPCGAYVQAVEHGDQPPRIGVLHEFFADAADVATRQHTAAIVERLERAGAKVRDVMLPPSFATVLAAHRLIMKVEAAAFHTDMFATQQQLYGPKLRETIEMGLLTSSVDYLRAQRLRRLFQDDLRHLCTHLDVLLTPSTPTPAPYDLTTTGDARFQAPWSYAGAPTLTLPSGLSQQGMPFGIQLIAPACHEEPLFRAARWCEVTLNVTLMPPL
jgi:aspartyl-tRNA(Asn)/glutamyl-tRNA(Gln) amidotransferase subunit A